MIKIDDDLSPNRFVVTEDEPKSSGDDGRLKHYDAKIREYNFNMYPNEWALCQYSLACVYHCDKAGDIFNVKAKKIRDGRARCIESALYHFDKCMEIFNYKKHPNIWAFCATIMGQVS